MEDLHRLNSGTCTELERLAAAAATMGYSDSLVAVHQPSLSVSAPVLPHQFPAEHFQRQYTRNDTHPRPTFEQVPRPPPTAHHQPAPPAHAHAPPPPSTIQYITDRTPHYGRNQFVTTDMQYANSTTIITTPTQPEPQYQQPVTPERTEPPPVQTLSDLGGNSVKKKKESQDVNSKKRKNENYVKEEARQGVEEDSEFKDSGGVLEVPSPIEDPEGGGLVWNCVLCNTNFPSSQAWQDHQVEHQNSANKRRNGLSLEVKIEIIKRINSGEKQSDMAEEYMVNRSTIKSIMKKANSYLQCWKKGMFHPDSKRLKGPKREDIEAALYSWYRQAVASGVPVSGSVLCSKALAFASKLGHTDFKATHGWLDRFKKRKNIAFGRVPSSRRTQEKDVNNSAEVKSSEWQSSILPQLLLEFEAGDIFAVEEVSFFYRVLPSEAPSLAGERCAGGIRSRQRLTVLLCGNMSGVEKFPLLVVGKHSKPSSFRHVKSLPVQYIANQKAWMTSDSFSAWLQDVDSWFVQQGRRVVILASSLPVHTKAPLGLRAVKLVVTPQGFHGPLKHGAVVEFKRNYRRGVLETLINQLQREGPCDNKRVRRVNVKLTLLTCLHQLAAAWHNISDVTISGSFTRAGISKYWNTHPPPQEQSMGAENLTLLHCLQTLGLSVPDMTFEDYVHFDDDVQVCNLNNDDDILAIVTGADKDDDMKYDDEEDDEDETDKGSQEETGPSLEDVESALATLRKHIQYQEGAQEMFRVLAHLEYLIYKGQVGRKGIEVQTTTPSTH
ncbi:tigger transposable element-derived protein 4-like [Macrobrachium rosenbergii]|uniref:tigger transposable element-derived protein 4-like n=1 Tax=Macrobrachium rosenbergii TaxID=79674 RepID=UPI0034D75AEA